MFQVSVAKLCKMFDDDRVLKIIDFKPENSMVFIPGEGDFMATAKFKKPGDADWSSFDAFQRTLGEGFAVQWIFDIGGLGEAKIVPEGKDPKKVFSQFVSRIAKLHSCLLVEGEVGEIVIQG
jgi:hypothetical protein